MIYLHNSAVMGDYAGFLEAWNSGMDLNLIDDYGWTPLNLSIIYNHIKCVQFLLDHQADPNAKDKHDSYPLHLATKNKHKECVQLLLDAGADPFIINIEGKRAKELTDDKDIIMLIEEHENRPHIKEPDD